MLYIYVDKQTYTWTRSYMSVYDTYIYTYIHTYIHT